MNNIYKTILDEMGKIFDHLSDESVNQAVDEIAAAKRIVVYGVGREGLQIKGLAMRLYHLGLNASVVGDMSCPPISKNDLLIISAGPGYFSTVSALAQVAKAAGGKVLFITATPESAIAAAADRILILPAPITQNNQSPDGSVMPMGGSLYEGAQYVLFEVIIIKLRIKLGFTTEQMASRHTNLE